jgi:hypothetical protein
MERLETFNFHCSIIDDLATKIEVSEPKENFICYFKIREKPDAHGHLSR